MANKSVIRPCTELALREVHPGERLVAAFFAGRNPRTVAAYREDLDVFRGFVGPPTLQDAAALLLGRPHGEANALVLAWKADMVERGLAAATINRRLAAVRSLVKLGRTLGLVPWALDVEGVDAQPYRNTRGPGVEAVRRMVSAVQARGDAKGVRDAAIIRLLHDLALRRGEVVSLNLEDLDLEEGRLAVLGKGRTAQVWMTVPPPTLDALNAWLAVRGTEPGPLFKSFDHAGKGSGRLTGAGVFNLVRDAGRAVGITVRPHGLRHTAITEALDATRGDVRKVQRFSRHRDVRTLQIYDDNRQDFCGEVAALVALP